MPVVPTTAYSQAEHALNLARALLNHSGGESLLTPSLLRWGGLPHLFCAVLHRE